MDTNDQQETPPRIGQWQKIIALPEERIVTIESCYEENYFSFQVRDFLAHWIETQPWSSISNGETAKYYLNKMVLEIKKCAGNQAFSTQRNLQRAAKEILEHYGNNPLKFGNFMRHILTQELSILEKYGEKEEKDPGQQTNDWTSSFEELEGLSKEIQNKISQAKELSNTLLMNLNAGNIMPARKKQQIMKSQDSNSMLVEKVNENVNDILKKALDGLTYMDTQLKEITNTILDTDLQQWIRNQRLHGNSNETETEIDEIQKWCSKITSLILASKQQIEEISLLQQIDLTTMNISFTELHVELLRRTFIVIEQPPQIIKIDKNMVASVRLLSVGASSMPRNHPEVTVELISPEGKKKGDLDKNTCSMQILQNQFTAKFEKMRLTKVKRHEGKKVCVTEEKFHLKFSMTIHVDRELTLQVLSFPVVVIKNVNQECKASATILWENFFADNITSEETEVPQKVLWTQFKDMLNYEFKKQIGVPLKERDFEYFASKIFGETFDDLSAEYITRDQIFKKCMNGSKFTFWDWFYEIEKLTRTHFADLYKKDFVFGFVGKKQAEEILSPKQCGTFLLRFSESRLGSISISRKGLKGINHHYPLTSDDFKNFTLAELILISKKLEYIYPDISTKQSLKDHVKNKVKNQSMKDLGYKKRQVKFVIESDSDDEESNSDTSGPQSNNSPEQMDTSFFQMYSSLSMTVGNYPPTRIFAGEDSDSD